ncbi:hypothetical protein AXG93_1962s1130 [Marchantia polymorpha subsp. ruderalis]|uniref:Uncharacterized protein n=1 Tax=Marchantia polymorpha subsp. ruderalis TaxID=1480154 RepID=A0A176WGI4_MARPO|nr:hypothetical protein AXG93_1962s1130 [Marchantia polymorpha subsp. ruderalis]
MSNDETCDDADSTTTIFSTSSQGSALSLISRNSAELLKLKQEIDTNMQDPRTEALALVNNLLEQRQTAVRLLEDISNRPTPEPYVAPALRTPQSLVQEESTEPVAEEEEMKPGQI